MRKISSSMTFLFKKVWPVIWVGGISAFIILDLAVLNDTEVNKAGSMPLTTLLFMLVFGYLLWKFLCSDLVDEAYDNGEYLVFKNGTNETRIFLKDIETINYNTLVSPERVSVKTKFETDLGRKIVFMPLGTFIPFKRHASIVALLERIDKAKVG